MERRRTYLVSFGSEQMENEGLLNLWKKKVREMRQERRTFVEKIESLKEKIEDLSIDIDKFETYIDLEESKRW